MRYLVTILLFLSSCNPFAVDPIAVYNIAKGEHKSSNKIAPIYSEKITFISSFNHSQRYLTEIPKNQNVYDINKLYGITSIDIHKNSARFGWRQKVGTNDTFELFAYWYKNGDRGYQKLGEVPIYEKQLFTIDVTGHYYKWKYERYLGNTPSVSFAIAGTKNITAFRAFPYFGGQNVAPHKMYFTITEL